MLLVLTLVPVLVLECMVEFARLLVILRKIMMGQLVLIRTW